MSCCSHDHSHTNGFHSHAAPPTEHVSAPAEHTATNGNAESQVKGIRNTQAPIKEGYRSNPDSALITLKSSGSLDAQSITCALDSPNGSAVRSVHQRVAGLHPAAGGPDAQISGELCSGDMLLDALVACAGVTLKSVAAALDIPIASGSSVQAEGDLNFAGVLGVDKTAPVGFTGIRLYFNLKLDESDAEKAKAVDDDKVALLVEYAEVNNANQCLLGFCRRRNSYVLASCKGKHKYCQAMQLAPSERVRQDYPLRRGRDVKSAQEGRCLLKRASSRAPTKSNRLQRFMLLGNKADPESVLVASHSTYFVHSRIVGKVQAKYGTKASDGKHKGSEKRGWQVRRHTFGEKTLEQGLSLSRRTILLLTTVHQATYLEGDHFPREVVSHYVLVAGSGTAVFPKASLISAGSAGTESNNLTSRSAKLGRKITQWHALPTGLKETSTGVERCDADGDDEEHKLADAATTGQTATTTCGQLRSHRRNLCTADAANVAEERSVWQIGSSVKLEAKTPWHPPTPTVLTAVGVSSTSRRAVHSARPRLYCLLLILHHTFSVQEVPSDSSLSPCACGIGPPTSKQPRSAPSSPAGSLSIACALPSLTISRRSQPSPGSDPPDLELSFPWRQPLVACAEPTTCLCLRAPLTPFHTNVYARSPTDGRHCLKPDLRDRSNPPSSPNMATLNVAATPTDIKTPSTSFAPYHPHAGSRNTSPLSSASGTPTNISPTSPRHSQSFNNPNGPPRQLRPPKCPMYVPAVLRPTERPSRHILKRESSVATSTKAPSLPITPPRSAGSSFDDNASINGQGLDGVSRRMLGEIGAMTGVSRIITDEWVEEKMEEVTGYPTRDHWKLGSETAWLPRAPRFPDRRVGGTLAIEQQTCSRRNTSMVCCHMTSEHFVQSPNMPNPPLTRIAYSPTRPLPPAMPPSVERTSTCSSGVTTAGDVVTSSVRRTPYARFRSTSMLAFTPKAHWVERVKPASPTFRPGSAHTSASVTTAVPAASSARAVAAEPPRPPTSRLPQLSMRR
ncbi:hypothetical protein FH972_025449 [Carpinus fangiana]|uniref:Uncharacterized protein n=1 Tax=Carpinus fangiana TaxID=176857 RepID=A0A5N6L228_9ROSI|nr:hypothetical protein FH972_025449 [Carpinus fangiana]